MSVKKPKKLTRAELEALMQDMRPSDIPIPDSFWGLVKTMTGLVVKSFKQAFRALVMPYRIKFVIPEGLPSTSKIYFSTTSTFLKIPVGSSLVSDCGACDSTVNDCADCRTLGLAGVQAVENYLGSKISQVNIKGHVARESNPQDYFNKN